MKTRVFLFWVGVSIYAIGALNAKQLSENGKNLVFSKTPTIKGNSSVNHKNAEPSKHRPLHMKPGERKFLFINREGKVTFEGERSKYSHVLHEYDGKRRVDFGETDNCYVVMKRSGKYVLANKELAENYGVSHKLVEDNEFIIIDNNGDVRFQISKLDAEFLYADSTYERFVFVRDSYSEAEADKSIPGRIYVFNSKGEITFQKEVECKFALYSENKYWIVVIARIEEKPEFCMFNIFTNEAYVLKCDLFDAVTNNGELMKNGKRVKASKTRLEQWNKENQ